MKIETGTNNCNRLMAFLNDKTELAYGGEGEMVDPPFLLKWYSRILDYNGCGPSGLSGIFLPLDEYMEMERWIADMPMATIYHHEAENKTIDNFGQILH